MEEHNALWRTAILRLLTGTLRPSGRAERTDLVIYGATILLGLLPISFVVGLAVRFDTAALFKDAVMLLVLIPVPALLARRLHDSGKSAVWIWLGLPAVGLWIARSAVAVQMGTDSRVQFDKLTWPLDWLSILTNLALLILLALPGTIGPNRFGEDPRGRAVTPAG